MTRIVLVRHGETAWNREGRFQGQQDVPLSAGGHGQARSLARALAGVPWRAAYASDLTRAKETAATILAGHDVPLRLDRRLREAALGAFEGKREEELAAAWGEALQAWRAGAAPPGGENPAAVQARAVSCLEEIARRHPPGPVLVVSHGGPIKGILCHLLGLPLASRGRLVVDNGSVQVLDVREGAGRLVQLNCRCLPPPEGAAG